MRPGSRIRLPGPPPSRAKHLLYGFREMALRLALLGSAWRARMLRLWRWVADQYTDDPRHPRTGKRKTKSKSAAHRPAGRF
jgi:hypothetical protein